MKFMPMAIEALWDELASGKAPDEAVAWVSDQYEVNASALQRLFEKRYERSPDELCALAIIPDRLMAETKASAIAKMFSDAHLKAEKSMQSYPYRLPDWQWEATKHAIQVTRYGTSIFAGYFEGDRHPLRFIVVESGQGWRMNGAYADELFKRLEDKYKA